jgi:uncharacterized protein YllA (UPF0747 family)
MLALNQDSLESFLKDSNHEQLLLKFQEMINKYRFMENHLLQRQQSLISKIPEIETSLEMTKHLKERSSSLMQG